jgi:hypothetical protein
MLQLTFGDIVYSYDLYFLLALALAVIVVFLFSMQKFAEPTGSDKDHDFLTPLLPKFMTTPQEYSRALIFYITTMILCVVLLSFLGPRVVALGSTSVPDAPAALPLFIALVLVGVLPNVPWLQELELHLRRFAHERALVPRAARATAEKLGAADIDFTRYNSDQVLSAPGMRGVQSSDMAAPRDTLEYAWARLSCLLYQLRRQQDMGMNLPFDGEVLDRYARDLDNLALKRKSLEDEIERYRAEKAKNNYYANSDLQRTIRQMLYQLYTLLGCAVRLKLDSDFIQAFGFELPPHQAAPSNRSIMIVGLSVMTASVFLVVYAAIGAAWLGKLENVWTPSELFPVQTYQPFVWAISSLLAHGTAILVGDWFRKRKLSRGHWFSHTSALPRRNPANYVLTGVMCALSGIVVNFLWGLLFAGPSWILAIYALPVSLLPAVTGSFYVYHLDHVELQCRPMRAVEVGLQAVVTGFCAFAATHASLGMVGVPAAVDYLALYFVVGLIVGGSLAWYIPRAANLRANDPLLAELRSRVDILKAEARKRFGRDDLADAWIDQPNSGLDNMSPRQGSASLATFEKALTILRANAPAAPAMQPASPGTP